MSSALTDLDLHLFGEGNHHHIYQKLGAHPASVTACVERALRSGRRMRSA